MRKNLNRSAMVRSIGAVLLSAALTAAPLLSRAAAPEPDVRRDATVAAIERVMPSVVNIATKNLVRVRDPFDDLFRQFWDPYHRNRPPDAPFSLGSGVIIDEAGYLLTNDHVVRRADQIAVKLATGTKLYEATVVASDPKTDVALLKLKAAPGEKFHAIRLAREDDLLLGETVLALGNPLGLGGTVTRGILSSKSRLTARQGESLYYPNWLQTDAPINHGNSGGPLVNLRGELIGINVAVVSQVEGTPVQGIGFAIPIRVVTEALSGILPTEFVKSYWFGARVKVGTSPLLVSSVQPESPAGRAGLKVGDVILEVNGQVPRSFIEFADLLASDPASDVALAVRRGNARTNLVVRLVPESTVFNADLVRARLGLTLDEMTPGLAASYGVNLTDGFMISGVEENGPAAAGGLQKGMLVTGIDGQSLSIAAVAKELYSKKAGDPVRMDIAVWTRTGSFNVLRQLAVEVIVR